jgi:hypothetical protein
MNNFKIFFSYRTADKDKVQELLNSLRELLPNFPFEDISENVPFADDWKADASRLIEECDGFVCIIGEDTYKSEPIDWEINEAARLGKPMYISVLSGQYPYPQACEEQRIEPSLWDSGRVAIELAEILLPKALFAKHDWSKGAPDPDLIKDQYNLMVQSWESLIERRQKVNTIYLSASSAILGAIGGLVSSMKNIGNQWSLAGIIILAALGFLLTCNWRRTITSYGTLSKAKSKVVSAFENYLPASLFDAEWRILEANQYKSTTQTDYLSAQLFRVLFLVISVTALVLIVINFI